MPPEPTDLQALEQRARKRLKLAVAAVILVASALVVLVLPIDLPRFVRLAVAGSDLLAASVLWLLLRRK